MTKDEIKQKVTAWIDDNPRTVAIIVGAVVMFIIGALWF